MSDPIVAGHGISVTLPATWEGRIYRRSTPTTAFTPLNRVAGGTGLNASAAGGGWLGEQTRPVVHLANFPLPADRGDYGSGAVESMGAGDVFLSLIEFGPEFLGTALYSAAGLPRVTVDRFDPNALQRRIPGQAGAQYFFTAASRPMCLYVVLGSARNAAAMTTRANQVLAGITVTPA
jgi:hypothetical protein